jgi:hypothetical protein
LSCPDLPLFLLALNMQFGLTLKMHPDPETVSPQVNALWQTLGVPMRMDISRVASNEETETDAPPCPRRRQARPALPTGEGRPRQAGRISPCLGR